MDEHKPNEVCIFRFSDLEERLDRMEDKDERRVLKENLIEKAILEIQISSTLTAKTLEKLEGRFESLIESKDVNWFKMFEKLLFVLLGLISALIGVKFM